MTLSLSKKNALSIMAMTLTMISLISPADAQTTCTSFSPDCCWVVQSWENMGKTTIVSAASATACCSNLVSTTQTSGIPGVHCTSPGVKSTRIVTKVTQIYWSRQSLTGQIPSSLGNLTNLERLYLNNNRLSGSIPSSLGNLAKLQWLYLFDNELSGSIPSSLGNLAKLQWLYLSNNQLSGFIPLEIGNLVNLQGLYLSNNKLNGSIPFQLGNLVNLLSLWLFDNKLSGPIPAELGNLENLRTLLLSRNTGLNGTFTPRCLTTSGAIPNILVSGTGVTICGCAAASNPPATFPPPGTPDECLATSYTGSTLAKRILAFSQVIEGYKYTCNTDSNQNPYADCLNTMAKICNTADSTFVKSNCQNGVNEMFKEMNSNWQAVRRECGQWQWTDGFTGSNSSSNCASANSNLRTHAFYIQNGQRVPVTSGLTESTNVGLWSKVTA